MLWLNDNCIAKLKGLEHNFRLKHLYLHNNNITTIVSESCCLPKLRHLETLQLSGNQLQDLKATVGVLSQLFSLRKLAMHGNPLASEAASILRREGLRGFYRGWLPAFCRLGPHALIQFPLYEQIRLALGLGAF